MVLFFLSLFQLCAIALVLKVFFLKPLQELPAVALLCLEKITFITSGLPLQSGAVCLSLLSIFCFKFIIIFSTNTSSTLGSNLNRFCLFKVYKNKKITRRLSFYSYFYSKMCTFIGFLWLPTHLIHYRFFRATITLDTLQSSITLQFLIYSDFIFVLKT